MNKSIAEFDAIRKTVDKYGEGISKGDIALLRSAFHPKAMMYGCHGESITMVEIEGLFSYVSAQESPLTTGEKHRCQITKMDLQGQVASVEVLQENCFGVHYVNYFQLLKIEGQWLIVSKAYDAVMTKESVQVTAQESKQVLAG